MRTKILAPLMALAIALLIAPRGGAAPEVNTWNQNPKVAWSDTISRVLGPTPDTTMTDSINVFGARYVIMLVTGDGSDSMATPVLQTKLPGGTWTYQGGALNIPPGALSSASPWTSAQIVSGNAKFVIGYSNEQSVTGGTPYPLTNLYFRWRLLSTDVRRYATANSATLAPTGKYTITVHVFR